MTDPACARERCRPVQSLLSWDLALNMTQCWRQTHPYASLSSADAHATAIVPPGGAFFASSQRCIPVDEALRRQFFLRPVPFRLLSVTRRFEERTSALRCAPCASCCACQFTVLCILPRLPFDLRKLSPLRSIPYRQHARVVQQAHSGPPFHIGISLAPVQAPPARLAHYPATQPEHSRCNQARRSPRLVSARLVRAPALLRVLPATALIYPASPRPAWAFPPAWWGH